MSVEQCVMDVIDSYVDGKRAYQDWRQQLQKTILSVCSIAREIQVLERSIQKGTIVRSSIGCVCGAIAIAGMIGAPLTFGGSLSLTAVSTVFGVGASVADVCKTWSTNSEIQSKCDEASTLLKACQHITAAFVEVVKNLHELHQTLCRILNTDHISLSAIGAAVRSGGDVLVGMVARAIPNIEITSVSLFVMFGSRGPSVGISFGLRTTEKAVAPMVGKVVSGVAKKSVRFVGTALVTIGVIVDVVNIVQNVAALDQWKLSDLVTSLEDGVNELKNEMTKFDKVFVHTG